MSLPTYDWKNKKGTSNRFCKCGSWKNHWLKFSGKSWPEKCSVLHCCNIATLGAHIINNDDNVSGEYIAPFCDSCNKLDDKFDLKSNTIVFSANINETC